jgi:drug/metabolite transporter (DMT)-like permease
MLVIPVSLAAALAFAVASYLKHRSAEGIPSASGGAKVASLVRETVKDPRWLMAIFADIVGVGLQVVALRIAALSVVQPLLVTTVIFALLLRHRLHQAVAARDFAWAAAATAALGGFLLLAGTVRQRNTTAADRLPALIAVVIGLVLAVSCVVIARGTSQRGRSAALLGIAVGVIYAGNAALLKTLTSLASRGFVAVVSSWQLWTLLGMGTIGLVLNQLAFQAGPITASLPALSTVDPLASIAIGVTVYDDPIRHGALASCGLAAALLVLGIAIIQLARAPSRPRGSPARLSEHSTT